MYENTTSHHRLRWFIAVTITLAVSVLFGVAIWFIVETQPADRQANQATSFQVAPGTSVNELGSQLKDKGIIRNATAFTWYVTISGLRRGLQAGSYELNPNNSTAEIADIVGHGRTTRNVLTIPEGSDVLKIRQLASDHGIDQKDFDDALTATYSNNFLSGRPSGDNSLEGYLFPDSYEVAKPPRPKAVIQQMLDTFAKKLNSTDISQGFAANGMTLHQGLTLASIVEKEVPNAADRATVAGIFMNRLRAGMPLESDVTVNYASEITGKAFSVQLDSPYNTYAHKGLPPGPICNPGIGSMSAVAHPQSNDYLYFVAGKDGKTHYAKTFAEHQVNVQKYLK